MDGKNYKQELLGNSHIYNRYQNQSVNSIGETAVTYKESVGTNSRLSEINSPTYGLESLSMRNLGRVYRNLPVPQLIEHALARTEGILAANGGLSVKTGKYTGRSPEDKFIVDEPSIHNEVDWNRVNIPISIEKFENLYRRVLAYLQGKDIYIFDGYVGGDPKYRMGVRVVNERASQNLFAHQMFIRPTVEELKQHLADFTVIVVPGLQGDPEIDGLNSEAFIIVSFEKKLVLIGGSHYAGEIKKSVFSFMNYFMTKRDVLPMHCAANMDDFGNTALFFGLSGTGKTTLSADLTRYLIGDDEHGWSKAGVFNFEGGCYAKTIKLSQQNEPQIWDAIRFGSLMENVVLNEYTRKPNYDDGTLTENTRVAYPLEFIPNYVESGVGGHPNTVIFLTADAFGVLPPIAKLSQEQAIYYFLSGYTSKLAGTERGITEPQAAFSACFGQPFLPLSPVVYADMLFERLTQHNPQVYLVNTGWSGGAYGVGTRIAIQYTRTMVNAALGGQLATATLTPHPIFKILMPEEVADVPSEILDPRNTWHNPTAYDQQAKTLAKQFGENFKRFATVARKIVEAGPQFEESV